MKWAKVKWWTKRIVLGFLAFSLLQVIVYKWVNPPITITKLHQKAVQDADFNYQWVDIENINKNMQLAIICGEDQKFCQHFGFDFDALANAAESNAKGKKRRGGSTISQQTAKNVFLWQGGSYIRKGLEAWYTLLIEIIWGKKRIMEVYLNVAETGVNTFGVKAGAKRYFNTSPKKLSQSQAAQMASLWPCPRRCGFLPARTRAITRAMRKYGIQLEYLN